MLLALVLVVLGGRDDAGAVEGANLGEPAVAVVPRALAVTVRHPVTTHNSQAAGSDRGRDSCFLCVCAQIGVV